MTDYGAGASSDFQRSTRMPLDAVVRLHFEGTVAFQNGFAANVSATGMFVKHPEPPPLGTRLVFEFTVGSARKPVQGTGEVVWSRDKYDGPGRPAGAGIRFVELDELSKQAITEALFEFLEMSLGDRVVEHPEVRAMVASRPTMAPLDPLTPADQPLTLPAIDGLATQAMPAFRPEDQETLSMPAFRPAEPVPAPTGSPPTPFRIFDDETSTAEPEPEPAPWTPPAWTPPASLSVPAEEPAAPAWETESAAPPRLAGAAAASDAPSSRGPWPWIAAAIALAAIAGGGWWFYLRPQPAEPAPAAAAPAPEPEPSAPPKPTTPPLDPAPGPGTTLAEAVGSSTTAPAVPLPAPTAPPAEVAAAAEPAAAAPAPSGRPAATVSSIASAAVAGGTVVTISGDGDFPTGRFSWSEIGGDKPRVLIKLKGIGSPYRGASAGSTAEVAGVRTGFHQLAGGPELHIVLDLVPDARVAVDAVEPAADGLVVRLSRR
ncbi:MAG: hypothetical protein AMXMBFR36_33040 [Acidobacteriota bacterium]